MPKRRALLIGVPEYREKTIRNLTVVHNDVRDLGTVLDRSGYEVRTVGTSEEAATRGVIRTEIRQILAGASDDETVFIYFSGHGVHYKGKDWLVPSDGAVSGDGFEEDLIHLDFASLVETSKARTVLFFIDACREGLELGATGRKAPLDVRSWGLDMQERVKEKRLAVVLGCEPGQWCHYVNGDDGNGFSLFTRALCHAIDTSASAVTLRAVTTAAESKLKELCKENGKEPEQTVKLLGEIDDELLGRPICDGMVLERHPGDRRNFRDPSHAQSLLLYCAEIAKEHGWVRFLGLPDLRDKPNVPISRLFVEPLVSGRRIPPDQPPADWPETTPLLDTLVASRYLVLLGDPGSGKSTLVSWISWRLAEVGDNDWTEKLGRLVPVPMILRDMKIGTDITWDGLLDGFLAQGVARPLNKQNAGREYLDDLLRNGQAMVMLDGLDEIGSRKARKALREAVLRGQSQYPRCRWLLTSRVVGYEEVPFSRPQALSLPIGPTIREAYEGLARMSYPDADRLRSLAPDGPPDKRYVAPFSDAQVEEFCHNWYVQHEPAEHRQQKRTRELVGAIAESGHTRELARIPNLLTLMALVYHVSHRLPHGRAMLYDRIAEAYLESIDRSKGLEGPEYSLAQKTSWLAYVGFKMQRQRGNQKDSHSVSKEREVLVNKDQIYAWITEAMGSTVEDTESAARRLVEYIARRSGLLLPRGEDRFGFVHLSFQEYFAACYIEEQVITPEWASGERTPLGTSKEALFEYAVQDVWRETLILLFEILADGKRKWIPSLTDALFGKDLDRWGEPAVYRDPTAAMLLAELAVDRYAGFPADQRRRVMKRCWEWELAFQATTDWQKRMWKVAGESVAVVLLGAMSSAVEDAWKGLERAWDRVGVGYLALLECPSSVDLHRLLGLTKLKTLDLTGTTVTDVSPLAGLITLQSLDLGKTQVTDVSSLAGLAALQKLNLSVTQVTDLSPLSGLTALKELSLHHTPVTDLSPLSGLTALQKLNLNVTQVTDLSPLSGLTALQALGLGRTEVTDLSPLSGLTALQKLGLGDTQVTDLSPLSDLTALQALGLGRTEVTDLSPLSSLTALSSLYLMGCTEITDAALEQLDGCKQLTNLETVGTPITTAAFERFLATRERNQQA